jgi:hypothetical protein
MTVGIDLAGYIKVHTDREKKYVVSLRLEAWGI